MTKTKNTQKAWLPVIWVTLASFAVCTLIILFEIKNETIISNEVHERNHQLLIENIKFRSYYENHSIDCSYELPNTTVECNLYKK